MISVDRFLVFFVFCDLASFYLSVGGPVGSLAVTASVFYYLNQAIKFVFFAYSSFFNKRETTFAK